MGQIVALFIKVVFDKPKIPEKMHKSAKPRLILCVKVGNNKLKNDLSKHVAYSKYHVFPFARFITFALINKVQRSDIT